MGETEPNIRIRGGCSTRMIIVLAVLAVVTTIILAVLVWGMFTQPAPVTPPPAAAGSSAPH